MCAEPLPPPAPPLAVPQGACWRGGPSEPLQLSKLMPTATFTFEGGAKLRMAPLQYLYVPSKPGGLLYCTAGEAAGAQGALPRKACSAVGSSAAGSSAARAACSAAVPPPGAWEGERWVVMADGPCSGLGFTTLTLGKAGFP